MLIRTNTPHVHAAASLRAMAMLTTAVHQYVLWHTAAVLTMAVLTMAVHTEAQAALVHRNLTLRARHLPSSALRGGWVSSGSPELSPTLGS
jgi:hypothetical protein